MTPRRRPTPPGHLHPIRVVTRRTGLSADLLRVWERRYDVVTPTRSANGRRLYSDADIERLGLLYRATLAGRGIGQLAQLSTVELAKLVQRDVAADRAGAAAPPERLAPAADQLAALVDECVRGIAQLDAGLLDASLRRAGVVLPVEAFLDALVVPLLERAGTMWREGTLPVYGHLAFVALRRALDRVIELGAAASDKPGIVVATPAGQTHELGAMLVAACAGAAGWRVTYLGAGLPAEDIGMAAARTGARAVALSIVHPGTDRALGHELRRLATMLPKKVELLAGGAAAADYAAVLEEIGAVRLADLAAFRARLRSLDRGRSRAR